MYHHVKALMYTVRIGRPDPRFGNMLLEQFAGANGELAAAMQYSVQGLNCEDPSRKESSPVRHSETRGLPPSLRFSLGSKWCDEILGGAKRPVDESRG